MVAKLVSDGFVFGLQVRKLRFQLLYLLLLLLTVSFRDIELTLELLHFELQFVMSSCLLFQFSFLFLKLSYFVMKFAEAACPILYVFAEFFVLVDQLLLLCLLVDAQLGKDFEVPLQGIDGKLLVQIFLAAVHVIPFQVED